MTRLCLGSAAMLLLILGAMPAAAQNPDLALSPAERDSILKNYKQIFPIWGKKAVERGFNLPLPVGLNINTVYVNQGIELGQLNLSTNDNPLAPVSWIVLGEAVSNVATVNFRGDLWVLPFLNVYGMYGKGWAQIDVPITDPVDFTSNVEQQGLYWGVGLTGTMGIKGNFLVVDVNWSWTDLEKLDEPVQVRILSLRYGRVFKINARQRWNIWVGAMNQRFATETNGSIALNEAIPPAVVDSIRNELSDYQNEQWYQDLGPIGQAAADSIVSEILDGDLANTTINYGLTKTAADPWNMLVGGTYELSRHWHLRSEFGFLGRFQALFVINYRFAL